MAIVLMYALNWVVMDISQRRENDDTFKNGKHVDFMVYDGLITGHTQPHQPLRHIRLTGRT
jgi:hypothetical protein